MTHDEQSESDEETIGEESKPFFVLSIDGGGFRGLSCLLVVAHLMQEIGLAVDEDVPPRPCQVFDLICGTSTGGLIAILLGRFGLSCEEAIDVYKEIGATMFNGEADAGKIWGNIIHGEQFSSAIFEKKLEEVVVRYTGSKDTLVKPLKNSPDAHRHESTQTFVTIVSRVGSAGVDAYRIRSYPRPPDDIDPAPYGHKWSIFEAARGTCAAPMYLSPLKIQQGHGIYVFQDAGFSGFNNPSTVALDEAEKLFGLDADITLISLGTGLRSLVGEGKHSGASQGVKEEDIKSVVQMILNSVSTMAKNAKNAPQLARRVVKQLLEVATDTELTHLHTYEQFDREGRRQDYYRFNPPRGLGDINLTDCKQEDAITSITHAWLTSPAGKKSISSLTKVLKGHYEQKKESVDTKDGVESCNT